MSRNKITEETSEDALIFEKLFDLMPQLGWTARPDGFIDFYNKGWYEYTGTTFEDMQGWGWQKFHDPQILPDVMDKWNHAIKTETYCELRFPLRRHDGIFRWFLTRINPIRDADGRLIRWVGINSDIQHEIDQAATLEKLVCDRTVELKSARDLAVAANEAKSLFFASVSHEVRTPLAGVIGLVELLTVSSENEENALMAQTALDAARRLMRILNDLLDASKLQAGKVTLEQRDFAIKSLIYDVVQLVKPEADSKGLELRCQIDADFPEIACGDELRLRQILLNLLANAVKFTSNGGVTISCKVARVLPDGVLLRFVVVDTGVGITESQRKSLFKPFVQADESTQRIFGGTGLGLSISKDLVGMMGGTIGVESQPDLGSSFWAEIPFVSPRL